MRRRHVPNYVNRAKQSIMGGLKTAVACLVAGLILALVLGFPAAPEYCSGRVGSFDNLVYDSNSRVVFNCTSWFRYLLLGH